MLLQDLSCSRKLKNYSSKVFFFFQKIYYEKKNARRANTPCSGNLVLSIVGNTRRSGQGDVIFSLVSIK